MSFRTASSSETISRFELPLAATKVLSTVVLETSFSINSSIIFFFSLSNSK